MQLEEALRQISDIRQQMAQSEVFRGYRSLTVAFSGIAACAAAFIQVTWVPSPAVDLGRYLGLWITVAVASLIIAGIEMTWRALRAGSGLARQHTLLAAQQFAPCVFVGALLTLCIFCVARDVAWMLPGLWSLIVGLGVFASCRLLPSQVIWVAYYYLLCGCACLVWGRDEHALSPWQMGITFGGGQILAALILYWTLERTDVAPQGE